MCGLVIHIHHDTDFIEAKFLYIAVVYDFLLTWSQYIQDFLYLPLLVSILLVRDILFFDCQSESKRNGFMIVRRVAVFSIKCIDQAILKGNKQIYFIFWGVTCCFLFLYNPVKTSWMQSFISSVSEVKRCP